MSRPSLSLRPMLVEPLLRSAREVKIGDVLVGSAGSYIIRDIEPIHRGLFYLFRIVRVEHDCGNSITRTFIASASELLSIASKER